MKKKKKKNNNLHSVNDNCIIWLIIINIRNALIAFEFIWLLNLLWWWWWLWHSICCIFKQWWFVRWSVLNFIFDSNYWQDSLFSKREYSSLSFEIWNENFFLLKKICNEKKNTTHNFVRRLNERIFVFFFCCS